MQPRHKPRRAAWCPLYQVLRAAQRQAYARQTVCQRGRAFTLTSIHHCWGSERHPKTGPNIHTLGICVPVRSGSTWPPSARSARCAAPTVWYLMNAQFLLGGMSTGMKGKCTDMGWCVLTGRQKEARWCTSKCEALPGSPLPKGTDACAAARLHNPRQTRAGQQCCKAAAERTSDNVAVLLEQAEDGRL